MLEYALIRAYFIWINEMAESVSTQEYEAISLELRDMKERINQLASAIGQDVRSLTEKNLKDLTLTGLVADYSGSPITATDSGVTALGKLQKQINNVDAGVANIDYSQALQELLEGFVVSAEVEDIRNDDNILTAFGKAQKYLQTLNQRVETIEQSSGSVEVDYSQALLENLTNMVVTAAFENIRVDDNVLTAFGKAQRNFLFLKEKTEALDYGFGITNLFKNTNNPTAIDPLQLVNGTDAAITGFTLEYLPWDANKYTLNLTTGERAIKYTDTGMNVFERGETYTWSLRAMGTATPVKFSIGWFDGNSWAILKEKPLELAAEWNLFNQFTFTIPNNAQSIYLAFDSQSATLGSTFFIEHGSMKIERGYVATGWMPTIEELQKPYLGDSIQSILYGFTAVTEQSDVNDTDSVLTALQKLQYMANDAYWKAAYIEDNYTAASTHEIWWDDDANDRTWSGIHYAPEDWRGEEIRNFPTWAAGILTVLKHPDYALVTQEYTTYVSLERWIRSFDGTTWTPWKQIVT